MRNFRLRAIWIWLAILAVTLPAFSCTKPAQTKAFAEQTLAQYDHDAALPDGVGRQSLSQTGGLKYQTAAQAALQDPRLESLGPQVKLTPIRPPTDQDRERASTVARQLRQGIEKYKNYQLALKDGFVNLTPRFPQKELHLSNLRNAFRAIRSFDPSAPSSLLYKKVGEEYQLIGAMYTAPLSIPLEELDHRVPFSMARWHVHVNFCLPPKGTTENPGRYLKMIDRDACDKIGGRFFPYVFGWMLHVYPFETDPTQVWRLHLTGHEMHSH